MKLHRLNLLSALISVAASCLWLALGQGLSGLIWLVCSLVWFGMAFAYRHSPTAESAPARRLVRRFTRLMIWS